jgi:outer membrane protein assembly factor BamB
MKTTIRLVSSCLVVGSVTLASAQDWPQWMGADRDGKAAGFTPPKTWPKELAQKWKVTVGDGVATPSLAGDRLYVFSRQEGGEILRCLEAASGKELWKDKYDAMPATGPAQGFSGPRSTPTVAEGKVVTLGLRGTLTCYDAMSGKQLWRKEEFKGSLPRFFTAASPLVADELCIAQLGGNESGGVVAYNLATGDEKWKWAGEGPAYASPVIMTVAGTKMVIAETDKKIVGLALADGKLVWETPFAVPGRGYNASTPIVDGDTLIYCGSGRGATAVKIQKAGDAFAAKELWKNTDNSVMFNTPVLKGGNLYGLTANNEFFCIGKDGKTSWTAPFSPASEGGSEAQAANPPPANAQAGPGGPGGAGGGRRGGRGMGGGRGGYGSIVDAGSVLLALTPSSELVAFQPSDKAFSEVARIKVAGSPTYAYPVVSGNRIFIKDQNDLMLYTVQ